MNAIFFTLTRIWPRLARLDQVHTGGTPVPPPRAQLLLNIDSIESITEGPADGCEIRTKTGDVITVAEPVNEVHRLMEAVAARGVDR